MKLHWLLCLLLLANLVASQETKDIKIKDANIKLSKDGSTKQKFSAAFPKAALDNVVLPADHALEVVLSINDQNGASFTPQQIMLLLTCQTSGAVAYLVGTKKSANTITVSQAALEKQVGKQGGVYELLLLVGDPAAPSGLTWKLGTIDVKVTKEQPAEPPRSATSQQHVFLEPEIIHQFRPADKRPPAPLSLAFAALPFVLLLGLVASLFGAVGANFKGFPSGAGSLWALLFHGGLAALLALYLAFWVKLNLAQTLPIAAVISLFVLGTGYKALSAVADARIAESRKKKE